MKSINCLFLLHDLFHRDSLDPQTIECWRNLFRVGLWNSALDQAWGRELPHQPRPADRWRWDRKLKGNPGSLYLHLFPHSIFYRIWLLVKQLIFRYLSITCCPCTVGLVFCAYWLWALSSVPAVGLVFCAGRLWALSFVSAGCVPYVILNK